MDVSGHAHRELNTSVVSEHINLTMPSSTETASDPRLLIPLADSLPGPGLPGPGLPGPSIQQQTAERIAGPPRSESTPLGKQINSLGTSTSDPLPIDLQLPNATSKEKGEGNSSPSLAKNLGLASQLANADFSWERGRSQSEPFLDSPSLSYPSSPVGFGLPGPPKPNNEPNKSTDTEKDGIGLSSLPDRSASTEPLEHSTPHVSLCTRSMSFQIKPGREVVPRVGGRRAR